MAQDNNEVVPTPSPPPISRRYGRKPSGVARRSNYPYYTELYGKQVKNEIMKMLENRKDIVYRYDVFCNDRTGMSKQTLYMRINQSIRYAVDHLDDEKRTLASWQAMVRIERRYGMGIRISFIPEFRASSTSDFAPQAVNESVNVAPQWKIDLDLWLEGDERSLKITELALTEDEIRTVKQSLKSLLGIVYTVKGDSISCMRV